MQRLRNITNTFVPPMPRCAGALPGESGHVLKWNGWWQSGNPEVAIPRWSCSCGHSTTDASRARRFNGEALGQLFHAGAYPHA